MHNAIAFAGDGAAEQSSVGSSKGGAFQLRLLRVRCAGSQVVLFPRLLSIQKTVELSDGRFNISAVPDRVYQLSVLAQQ